MCRIWGTITKDRLNSDILTSITRIKDQLIHGRSDIRGKYGDDKIIHTMSRLSIIDLPIGRQPLDNEDGTLVLITNGEIYNCVSSELKVLS